MAEQIRKVDFECAVEQMFEVRGAGIRLKLESVSEGAPAGEAYECFSLDFRGPKDRVFQQGTFELSHEKLGVFPLFMTAVAEDDSGRVYQAVFNRKKEGA